MIGRVAGVVLHKAADHVLIDVRGVGYLVHISARTAASLPPAGEAAALYTDLLVREDLLQLFGFSSLLEKEWYRLLVTVQGVGAKAAMAIDPNMPASRSTDASPRPSVLRCVLPSDWSAMVVAKSAPKGQASGQFNSHAIKPTTKHAPTTSMWWATMPRSVVD